MKNQPALAWLIVALAVCLPALLVGVSADPFESTWALHPSQGWSSLHPWSLWSAAWVHASPRHAQFNLLAGGLVGWLGWTLRAPAWAAVAWMLAWPATHALLMLDPRLGWYVGASGVLHAGVAVLAVVLWQQSRRWAAVILGALLLLKVGLDVAAGLPLASRAGLDVPMAPLSHLSGVLAGLVFAGFHHGRISHTTGN